MISFPQKRFDEEKLHAVVDAVERFDPDLVVAFGGSNTVADLFARSRAVVCIPTSTGITPSLARLILGFGPEDGARGWPEEIRDRFRPFSFGYTLPETGGGGSRGDFGLPDEGPVYVVVGNRLDIEAGPEFLARLDALLDRVPAARVAFAGAVESLPERVAALRNAPRFHVLGHVDDIRALYRVATAYLNPPRQGGGGSAAFALAEGLPVVTLPAGDVASIAGGAFIVVDQADFEARAAALADDADLRASLSAQARSRFAEAADRKASVEKLMAYGLEAQQVPPQAPTISIAGLTL
nr:glycosyltransferase [Azospirillum thermophilum]